MAWELITLTPRLKSNVIAWEMCQVSKSNCGGPGSNPVATPYPEIIIDKGVEPLVVFQVRTEAGGPMGITFASDAANPLDASKAFWVTTGKGKHPIGGHNSKGQFDNVTLPAPTALVFTDKNNNNEWFSYVLNFVGPDGQKVTSIDPDILNGGKGRAYDDLANLLIVGAIVAALVSAFVAAFVASFVAKRIARRQMPQQVKINS